MSTLTPDKKLMIKNTLVLAISGFFLVLIFINILQTWSLFRGQGLYVMVIVFLINALIFCIYLKKIKEHKKQLNTPSDTKPTV